MSVRHGEQTTANAMIDTVKFKQPLLVETSWRDFVDSDTWKSTFTETPFRHQETDKMVVLRRWHLIHLPTGLRASGTEHALHTFEVSLPRVLFGHNGRLLQCQAEIDEAVKNVRDIVEEVGEWLDDPPEFTRIDLVWQFKVDPKLFIAAHKEARHRRIQRDVVQYENGSLTWRGSCRSVLIYDKLQEMKKMPGDVVRAEVQLRGQILKRLFGPQPIRHLDFDQCYEVYRNTMLGFCPKAVSRVSNLAEFLAVGQREGWQSGGIQAFELYCQRLGRRQRRRLQRQVAQARKATFGFDWADLLPDGHPPAPVEITDEMLAGAFV